MRRSIRRLIEVAKEGDVGALRLCIDRICPPQRERPVGLELPQMTSAADAAAAMGAIIQAIGDGDLGTREAAELAKVVASFSQSLATANLEQRLTEIERVIELVKTDRASAGPTR